MTDLSRRSLLGFIAASPFIVRAASLMPVKMLLPAPVTIVTVTPTVIEPWLYEGLFSVVDEFGNNYRVVDSVVEGDTVRAHVDTSSMPDNAGFLTATFVAYDRAWG